MWMITFLVFVNSRYAIVKYAGGRSLANDSGGATTKPNMYGTEEPQASNSEARKSIRVHNSVPRGTPLILISCSSFAVS